MKDLILFFISLFGVFTFGYFFYRELCCSIYESNYLYLMLYGFLFIVFLWFAYEKWTDYTIRS